jgi:hypothetical protein
MNFARPLTIALLVASLGVGPASALPAHMGMFEVKGQISASWAVLLRLVRIEV